MLPLTDGNQRFHNEAAVKLFSMQILRNTNFHPEPLLASCFYFMIADSDFFICVSEAAGSLRQRRLIYPEATPSGGRIAHRTNHINDFVLQSSNLIGK